MLKLRGLHSRDRNRLRTMGAVRNKLRSVFYIDCQIVREALAEFIGTTLFLAAADAALAKRCFARKLGSLEQDNQLYMCLVWPLSMMFALSISLGTSGALLNPAISFSLSLSGHLSWIQFIACFLVQHMAAMFATALIYATYYDALNNFDGGVRRIHEPNGTAAIFVAASTDTSLSVANNFADQIFGSFLFIIIIQAICDERNTGVPKYLIAPFASLSVALIALTCSSTCPALNPARELGGRLFIAIAGWGFEVFSLQSKDTFWIYVFGPYIGALLATVIYQLTVGLQWSSKNVVSFGMSTHTSMEVNLSTDGNENECPKI